jgi:type I restriction enzyme S subunit
MSVESQVELGDLIDTLKGYAFKSKDYNHSGVPVVRVSDFTDNSISEENLVYLSHAIAKDYGKYCLEKNDIIIQTVGSWQSNPASIVGKVIKVPLNLKGALLNQNAVKIIPNSRVNKNFLYYRLKDQSFKMHVIGGAQGAANQASITLSTIKKFSFFLPSLPIQQKIAGILSGYDDAIENNLRRIKLLEEMAQITYEEWFVRLRFPGHESTTINEATGLPEGWKKARLGDMCHLTMGQSPKSEFYNTDGNGLPFHQGVKDYGERFPSNASWSTEGARYAERGDVLFSVRAPVGRLNIALEKMILGRGLAAICHKQKAQGFLYCLLKKQFFAEDMIGGGAIFNSVTKSDMFRIDVVQPDENTLQKFNQIVSATDREIEVLHHQNQRLREARDILLPRLMTGVIDVEKYPAAVMPLQNGTQKEVGLGPDFRRDDDKGWDDGLFVDQNNKKKIS